MERTPEDKMEDELVELASAAGYIVLAEEGFQGRVYHIMRRAEFHSAMLSNWAPTPRCH